MIIVIAIGVAVAVPVHHCVSACIFMLFLLRNAGEVGGRVSNEKKGLEMVDGNPKITGSRRPKDCSQTNDHPLDCCLNLYFFLHIFY
jgi:hypothetical protein